MHLDSLRDEKFSTLIDCRPRLWSIEKILHDNETYKEKRLRSNTIDNNYWIIHDEWLFLSIVQTRMKMDEKSLHFIVRDSGGSHDYIEIIIQNS